MFKIIQAGLLTQVDLEDQILELLQTASGSLLDDMALIDALEASKATARDGAIALQASKCLILAEFFFFFLSPNLFPLQNNRLVSGHRGVLM